MDPITAATLLFSGITKVKELFSGGKKLMEEVKGTPSNADNPEALRAEFDALTPDQQQIWIDKMAAATAQYEAETARIKTQEEVSSELMVKVDPEMASKIAYLRQATRPWTVKQMVYLMLFPFYLIALDVIQHLVESWLLFWTDKIKPFESFIYVFGSKNGGLMDKLGNLVGPMPKTLAGQMYIEALFYASAIIGTYMTLREIGKYRDNENGGGIINSAAKVMKKTGLFRWFQ